MTNIYDTTDFPMQSVRLGTPFNKGGVHFIKMTVSETPIYIQPPKCIIKQGFVKSGKKIFCDLVFSIEDNSFLSWLEKIEEVAKQQIYENRAKWFETELNEHDIEDSITSPYKMYKSGKWYIIRANVPNTLGKSDLKIYDENETEIFHENLTEETSVHTILEIKGIKCSARSFQFDIDIRQMQVVSPVKIFEKCIIRKSADNIQGSNSNSPVIKPDISTLSARIDDSRNKLEETFAESLQSVESNTYTENENENETGHSFPDHFPTTLPAVSSANFENRIIYTEEEPDNEMREISLNLDEMGTLETVQIKKRNEVHYQMYKEAKQKAKEAKIIALSNYLEAKRIKNTYSLEDSSDDESDTDLEEEFVSKIPSY